MSATVDANLLLYASDLGSDRHHRARQHLQGLAAGPELLYVFWPVAVAYLRIATHHAIFEQPLPRDEAWANLHDLTDRPHVRVPGEQPGFHAHLGRSLTDGDARGNLVSDAHLVALMRQHGVRRIWTSDRDFRRWDGIEPVDPFD